MGALEISGAESPALGQRVRSSRVGLLFSPCFWSFGFISHQRLNKHLGDLSGSKQWRPRMMFRAGFSIELFSIVAHYVSCRRCSMDVSVVTSLLAKVSLQFSNRVACHLWTNLFVYFDLKSNVHQWLINYIS